jgi:hypothetical protein
MFINKSQQKSNGRNSIFSALFHARKPVEATKFEDNTEFTRISIPCLIFRA